jgi:hypothetical protein
MALKAAGHSRHSRTRDAIRVLLDRQLPHGGWNYGNTLVLGRELRFHVQATSLALLGLATESDLRSRTAASVDILEKNISPQTTTASLAWALMALSAYGRALPHAQECLGEVYQRCVSRTASTHKLALIALGTQQQNCLLVTLPQTADARTRGIG